MNSRESAARAILRNVLCFAKSKDVTVWKTQTVTTDTKMRSNGQDRINEVSACTELWHEICFHYGFRFKLESGQDDILKSGPRSTISRCLKAEGLSHRGSP